MLYGVVLAGGRSSRMGENKALLRWRGKTLLECAECLLTEAGVERLLVSGRVPGREDTVLDPVPDKGPPGALNGVVQHVGAIWGLKEEPMVVIPVDMPKLHAGIVRQLLDVWTPGQALHYSGEIFPCVLTLDEHLRTYLANGVVDGDGGKGYLSMKQILAMQKARAMSVTDIDPAVFDNANTPADWQRLCAR